MLGLGPGLHHELREELLDAPGAEVAGLVLLLRSLLRLGRSLRLPRGLWELGEGALRRGIALVDGLHLLLDLLDALVHQVDVGLELLAGGLRAAVHLLGELLVRGLDLLVHVVGKLLLHSRHAVVHVLRVGFVVHQLRQLHLHELHAGIHPLLHLVHGGLGPASFRVASNFGLLASPPAAAPGREQAGLDLRQLLPQLHALLLHQRHVSLAADELRDLLPRGGHLPADLLRHGLLNGPHALRDELHVGLVHHHADQVLSHHLHPMLDLLLVGLGVDPLSQVLQRLLALLLHGVGVGLALCHVEHLVAHGLDDLHDLLAVRLRHSHVR
mmetsp:Transcript_7112/g.22206  ORF Transcript_7112/g.22206 Transcript_7112/m.22206 type:complete len:327 (-) Transcript_7112:981-1961(-)